MWALVGDDSVSDAKDDVLGSNRSRFSLSISYEGVLAAPHGEEKCSAN